MRPVSLRRTPLLVLATLSAAAMPASASRSVQTAPALGVQFHCNWPSYTDASRARVLGELDGGSLSWVRIDVSWADLQPTPRRVDGTYASRFDRCVTLARA